MKRSGTVVAVAGRRIDVPAADAPRFPPALAPRIGTRVAAFLEAQAARVVVASAASGADILALEAAQERGLRTRIVLPYARDRFCRTSVEDGGEAWVARFRRVLAAAGAGDITDLDATADDGYALATEAIVRQTLELAAATNARPIALAIWDPDPGRRDDATRDFVEAARQNALEVFSIPILKTYAND